MPNACIMALTEASVDTSSVGGFMRKLFSGNKDLLQQKVMSINLEPIMVKLMDKEEGKSWSLDQTQSAVDQYRRFLILSVTRHEDIVPTKTVDTVWHYHILDTMKYAEDCENVFGFFLHHFPYFGMRGVEDRLALDNAFEKTAAIYEAEFGGTYGATQNADCQPSCSATGTCNAIVDNFELGSSIRSYERPSLPV